MFSPDYKIVLCDLLNPSARGKSLFLGKQAMVLKKNRLPKGQTVLGESCSYLIDSIMPEDQLIGRTVPFLRDSIEILDARGFIALPSFFDMHFHWVQDDVRLMPKDSLLNWLSKYTWPYEQKFESRAYSLKKSLDFSAHLLSCGTLGGASYGSIHGHTVDHALSHFIGDFIVGNVLMTMNSPKGLCTSVKEALGLIKEKSQRYKTKYALTPRFAPTTHPEVMLKGSSFAKKNRGFIQTHLSETPEEVAYVLALYKKLNGFSKIQSYTEIYSRCGILGPRTLLGHGLYLDPSEIKLITKSKSVLIHCPTSNAPIKNKGLGSGLFDYQKMNKAKVRWALGSDIGGGPYLSMFDVIQSFVEQNRAMKKEATYSEGFYRATLAGAEIMGLSKKSGSLEKGKEANFILVPSPLIKNGKNKTTGEEVLEKLISKFSKKRERYADLVHSTYYQGHLAYSLE